MDGMSQTMLFQNLYISFEIWSPVLRFPLVAWDCAVLFWVSAACTVCSIVAGPVADVEFDVAANITAKSKWGSLLCRSDCPWLLEVKVCEKYSASPECHVRLFSAVLISVISDEKAQHCLLWVYLRIQNPRPQITKALVVTIPELNSAETLPGQSQESACRPQWEQTADGKCCYCLC